MLSKRLQLNKNNHPDWGDIVSLAESINGKESRRSILNMFNAHVPKNDYDPVDKRSILEWLYGVRESQSKKNDPQIP